MRVLYAIQATGNGHVSRANEIIPFLEKKCELDLLISGTQADVGLNHPVKYKLKGLSFVFGKKGGVDFVKTYRLLQSKKFINEIKTVPVESYDLVLNDFEPVTAWACKLRHIPCLSMSHQFAVLQKEAPRPEKIDPFAWMVLRHYAPVTAGVGFHFKKYNPQTFTPVIRREIRQATVTNDGHYTVYLPAYSDKKIIDFLGEFPHIKWQVFSKHSKETYSVKNCHIQPVNTAAFTKSFTSCKGILCGAGFETPAEAIFMGKKLMVIPMKSQYEQHCNAAGAADLGVPVLKSLKKKHLHKVESWLQFQEPIHIDFPDETDDILDKLLTQAGRLIELQQGEQKLITAKTTVLTA